MVMVMKGMAMASVRYLTVSVALTSIALGVGHKASAQQDQLRDEYIAIRARRVETVSDGVIENGTVLIRNGKIASVGKSVRIPVGAREISVHTVIPGIVGAHSTIGLSASGGSGPVQLPPGIPPQFAGRFGGGGGGRAAANTHYRVVDELYPFDPAYERLARTGVTTLGLVPGGRGFTGQGAVIRTIGAAPEKMALAQAQPLAIHFASDTPTQDLIRSTLQGGGATGGGPAGGGPVGGGGTGGRSGFGPEIVQTDISVAVDDLVDDFQRGRGRPFQRPEGGPAASPSSLTAAARRLPITRAMAGEIPTYIECDDIASTTYALALFQSFDKLKPVFILPTDAFRIADMLGGRKVSVILAADMPFEPNTRNRVNAAAILVKAGAKVACVPASDSALGYEGLLARMAELIKSGLDRTIALRSITLSPAEMLGAQDRVGSVQIGRDANLVLLDGDPFSALTKITRVLLEGKTVYDGR